MIIADVIFLILESIFPFQSINRLSIAKFDLFISILLIVFLALNYFIFHNKKSAYDLNNIIIIIFAVIPFEFIFLSLFGFNMGVFPSISLYVLRIFHLIGLALTLRIFGSKFIAFSRKNGLGYGIIAITSIFILGSVLFFIFEGNVNPNVFVYEDAIWFSLVSITTTGYGDITPVTLAGRVIAGFLMISGVSFATFATASVASSIITKLREEKSEREKNLEEYNKTLVKNFEENQKELSEIKNILKKLEK